VKLSFLQESERISDNLRAVLLSDMYKIRESKQLILYRFLYLKKKKKAFIFCT